MSITDGQTVVEYRGYKLSILEMEDLANIAATWQEQLRRGMVPAMDELGLSPGQKLIIMREFALEPPGFQAVVDYCLTPAGIDVAIMAAVKRAGSTLAKVSDLGTPRERRELVAELLQLRPASGIGVADPTTAATTTAPESVTIGASGSP